MNEGVGIILIENKNEWSIFLRAVFWAPVKYYKKNLFVGKP